jgi:hypothetical protein
VANGSRRAEVAVAAAWFALGAAIAVGSWRMDRLADRAIEPWSAPGLTPGIVGVLLMVFAAVVGLRAARGAAEPEPDAAEPAADGGATLRRTLLAGGLCVAFAAGLGHGVPFTALGVAFVFAFTAVFSWADWRACSRLGRGAATAFAVALVATFAVALLFERVFLVRLP